MDSEDRIGRAKKLLTTPAVGRAERRRKARAERKFHQKAAMLNRKDDGLVTTRFKFRKV